MSKTIQNRVNQMRRPGGEFPRKFVPVDLDVSEWSQLEPLFQELIERPLTSAADVEAWLADQFELGSVIGEEESRRYIAMTCATDDAEAEKAFLHFVEEIQPKIKPLDHKLNLKLVDCPHTSQLDAGTYGIMLRSVKNQIELFREENIPLETELDKLSQQYQKLIGAMTVNFRGQERTMQQMGVFMQETDRAVRREAFELSAARRLQEKEKLEDIFDKMLELRQNIAANAGFENFRDYQFRRYNRFDYTPADCESFHTAVGDLVVPLSRRILEERRKSLKLDSVKPYDVTCDRYGRNPLKPFNDTDKLAVGCREIFSKVDPELGEYFNKMIEFGLLDLDSRKGKAPGGYQTTLSELRLPFIFMNAVGLNGDLFTLLHEGGHAFHTFLARGIEVAPYRHAPMEFSEVASMSMELLGMPFLNEFYSASEAARARRDELEGIIMLLPWIATVDAFQHWIYTHPGHSRPERMQHWTRLMERFGSGVDFSGYEEVLHYRWHAQLHIFEYPFYYIEYGIAQLGALQVWRNALNNKAEAVQSYKRSLGLGGSRTLPNLFQTAAAKFDFSAKTIGPLMEAVGGAIDEEAKLEAR